MLGHQGGQQFVNLVQPPSARYCDAATVVHVLGHAIGLDHAALTRLDGNF